MNISCAICAEIFKNSDANSINITHCGHVFHNACLSQWLERSKTCPECRNRTTFSSIIRVYYNVSSHNDSSMISSNATGDVALLQSENDNLKFQLLEKSGAIKSKEKNIQMLTNENKKLKTNQVQSREIILSLEQKIENNAIIHQIDRERIKSLKLEVAKIDAVKKDLAQATEQIRIMDVLKQILSGAQKEAEDLLSQSRTIDELALMATALKRELRMNEAKRQQLRLNNDTLSKDLRKCREEKLKLEEKFAILESKVFQMDNKYREKENEDSFASNVSMDTTNDCTETFSDPPIIPRKKTIIEKRSMVNSPYLKIRSSSIAGLSPMLKRPESSGSSIKSTQSNSDFTIFKKPRLMESQTKKSIIRPSKLTNPIGSSATSSKSSSDNDTVAASTSHLNPLHSVIGSSLARLDGRNKFIRLSKPK